MLLVELTIENSVVRQFEAEHISCPTCAVSMRLHKTDTAQNTAWHPTNH